MAKTTLEFYATAVEQQRWMEKQFSNKEIWCLVWRFSEGYQYWPAGSLDIKHLSFDAKCEDELILFFGLKELVGAPVWRSTSHGETLDFKKSLAIQFVPSLEIGKDILLEGRLSIMQQLEYEQERINPKPLFRWYRELAKSLASIKAHGVTLIQHTVQGGFKEWRSVVVSPGAVEWVREGKRLKQFPKGEVEFGVKVNTGC